jgi:PAS domain S-box-containing protein
MSLDRASLSALPVRRPLELTGTLENVRVPCFIADRQGTLTWLNGAAKEAFGDLTGRPFTAVVAPEDVAMVQRQLARKLQGAPVTDYEVHVSTADGRRRRAEVSSVPIRGGDHMHAIFGIALPRPARPARGHVRLTPRQNEVLQLLGDGASTDDMASSLSVSRETVRNHVRHVLRELGAHTRLEAVAVAHRSGLLGEE